MLPSPEDARELERLRQQDAARTDEYRRRRAGLVRLSEVDGRLQAVETTLTALCRTVDRHHQALRDTLEALSAVAALPSPQAARIASEAVQRASTALRGSD